MFICKENYLKLSEKLSEIQHSQFLSQFLNSIYQLVQVCWDTYQIVSSIRCTDQIFLNIIKFRPLSLFAGCFNKHAVDPLPRGAEHLERYFEQVINREIEPLSLLFENDSDRFQNLRDLVQVESESSSAFPAQGLIINFISERENRYNKKYEMQFYRIVECRLQA
ncbi:Hypothetical_protein [Hexamita inflata]|uniref:Hypothetical_protein n=1 Tax=Hexamita inflata TaxID=28002 RepID=A0AA86PFC1_9EUKA|nr:Hypothetical protein HINF_LOCUS22389 [Hexamita inflata]